MIFFLFISFILLKVLTIYKMVFLCENCNGRMYHKGRDRFCGSNCHKCNECPTFIPGNKATCESCSICPTCKSTKDDGKCTKCPSCEYCENTIPDNKQWTAKCNDCPVVISNICNGCKSFTGCAECGSDKFTFTEV